MFTNIRDFGKLFKVKRDRVVFDKQVKQLR